jgi:TM2 domain-containing membrane protein YozV
MAEKSKGQIADELRAEYRATIKRTADDEDALRRSGPFSRSGTKSIRFAYFLWFLLGGFGAHRFYLGRPLSGAAMLALMIGGVVSSMQPALAILMLPASAALSVWWLADAFLIPKMLP